MNKKFIWVTFQKEGFHSYPAALTDEKLQDVKFLGYPHRHLFHFKVSVEVGHDDRDIEFFQIKRWLQELYDYEHLSINNQSCEMLNSNLAKVIQKNYPNRALIIEVSEDLENGCTTYYE